MSALDVLLRIAGKDNFQLDPDIDMGTFFWKFTHNSIHSIIALMFNSA